MRIPSMPAQLRNVALAAAAGIATAPLLACGIPTSFRSTNSSENEGAEHLVSSGSAGDHDRVVGEGNRGPGDTEQRARNNGDWPYPDHDCDRIHDDFDRCPGRKESYNGVEDEDGCPNTAGTVISAEIVARYQIWFAAGLDTIDCANAYVLDVVRNEILNVWGSEPSASLRIVGYASEEEASSMELARGRVRAVMAHLSELDEHGRRVDPQRVEVQAEVLAPDSEGNPRRVEFSITGARIVQPWELGSLHVRSE